jgi:hypothetical protein
MVAVVGSHFWCTWWHFFPIGDKSVKSDGFIPENSGRRAAIQHHEVYAGDSPTERLNARAEEVEM